MPVSHFIPADRGHAVRQGVGLMLYLALPATHFSSTMLATARFLFPAPPSLPPHPTGAADHLLLPPCSLTALHPGRVGKTSILLRYCRDTYDDRQQSTLQASYLDKQIMVGDKVRCCRGQESLNWIPEGDIGVAAAGCGGGVRGLRCSMTWCDSL